MTTLLLLRHANSGSVQENIPDIDRPLNDRGRTAAHKLAQYMFKEGLTADVALCSPAIRARETLDHLSVAFLKKPKIEINSAIYGADVSTLLDCLRSISKGIERALLIGHNPSIGDLASTLAGDRESKEISSMGNKFPTAALAIFEFNSFWSELDPTCAAFVRFVTPSAL